METMQSVPQKGETGTGRWLGAAGVAALLASSCCLGPVVPAALSTSATFVARSARRGPRVRPPALLPTSGPRPPSRPRETTHHRSSSHAYASAAHNAGSRRRSRRIASPHRRNVAGDSLRGGRVRRPESAARPRRRRYGARGARVYEKVPVPMRGTAPGAPASPSGRRCTRLPDRDQASGPGWRRRAHQQGRRGRALAHPAEPRLRIRHRQRVPSRGRRAVVRLVRAAVGDRAGARQLVRARSFKLQSYSRYDSPAGPRVSMLCANAAAA